MAEIMDRYRLPQPDPQAGQATDAELMLAVAQRRDVAAFERLFNRYERAAFNLAKHLTGSVLTAEDAVQDAALRLWGNAERFRPEGNFKGWFFTIVANCSRKRSPVRTLEEHLVECHGSNLCCAEPEAAMNDQELSGALRDQMARLEPLERSLLALYYGAGLDQREIGRTLDMPQTTVSLKIREALGKLRAGLTSAGYAAAAPLLESGRLGDVVLNEEAVPDGLHGKIMQRLAEMAKHSVRSAAAVKSAFGFWTAIVVCTALVIAAYVYSRSGDAQVGPSVPPVEATKTASIVAPKSVSKKGDIDPRFRRKWDFDDASQLDEFFGSGHGLSFVPSGGPDGSGCIDTRKGVVQLDINCLPELRLPVRARWKEKMIGTQKLARVLLGWSDDSIQTFAAVRNAGAIFDLPTGAVPWRRGEIYLSDHFYDQWLDGQRTAVEYLDLSADPQLAFVAKGRYLIDDMEVEEISADELPDLTEFKRLIDGIPAEKRTGQLDCPGLKSARPSEHVFIEFLRSPARNP